MAPTAIAAPDATIADQPMVAGLLDLGAGHAVDAVNGNSTPNNGLLFLYVTCTAADATFTVHRPEGPENEVFDIATVGHLYRLGPFDPTEFGHDLVWTGLATTTVRIVQQDVP